MTKHRNKTADPKTSDRRNQTPKKLSVEELEARIAPTPVVGKKAPAPAPYAPGTLYGLIRRDNLER